MQEVIKMQNADGSWTNQVLIGKFSKNKEYATELSKKVNVSVVITKLVVLWIQKRHNTKQYSLILKKAQAWLKRKIAEEAIDEEQLNKI